MDEQTNRVPTVLIFDTYVKFLPSTKRFEQSLIHSVVEYLYDPALIDYSMCSISNLSNDVITDSRLYDSLKDCSFIDSLGVFKTLGGHFSDYKECDDTTDEICTKVKSAIETVCMFYPNFPSEELNVTYVDKIYTDTQVFEKKQDIPPKHCLCGQVMNERGKDGGGDVLPVIERIRKEELKHKSAATMDLPCLSLHSKSLLGNRSAKYEDAYTSSIFAKNSIEYVILKNTEEDTLSYLPASIYNECSTRHYIYTFFPEFTKVGELYTDDVEDIRSILHEHTDKSADEVWHLLQANATTTLPGTICPSKKRIEKTVRKIYNINKSKSQIDTSDESLIHSIIDSIYSINNKPTDKVIERLKRNLPRVLSTMGLKMKRVNGVRYWNGIEDTITTTHMEGQPLQNARQ